MKKNSALVVTFALVVVGVAYMALPSHRGNYSANNGQQGASTLSATEVEGLVYMREEEKLARDVYRVLGSLWGLPFTNIVESEQRHMEAVRVVLDRYNVSDPVTDDAVGVFKNPILTRLYETLVAKGMTSRMEALIVGATIEELDIADIEKYLRDTNTHGIVSVYEELARGSRNHLRAFDANISVEGGVFTPQYISLDAYNNIVNSDTERGNIR